MSNTSEAAGVGGQHHDKASLAADAREFVVTLEETHPDPYEGHGGRVAFHRRLEDLVHEIPDGGESTTAFARRLQSFAARVRDGHTKVDVPESATDSLDGRLPLAFRVVGDALYVEATYEDAHADLVGGRLRDVEGVALPDLRERMARRESSDNEYGDRYRLTDALGPNPANLRPLVDTTAPTVTVETPDGDRVARALSPTDADDPVRTLTQSLDHPATSGEPAFRLLDDGRAALLAIPDCHSHREVLEFALDVGGEVAEFYDLRETYSRIVDDPIPDDEAELLAGLPAATNVFVDLVAAMADADTETLVVDVRGNTGGSSLVAYALTYALHGRVGVAAAAGDQYSVSKASSLYDEWYGDTERIEATDNPAGYDFSSHFRSREDKGEASMEELTSMSETFASAVEDETINHYAPDQVVVVTDAETFSAGLEPALLLSKLGADVAGVPSAQSPNGPRDVLSDDLTNTGLTVKTSYRHHVFLPGEEGNVFRPDVPLTPARFDEYDCAADAGIRLAIDHAAGELRR